MDNGLMNIAKKLNIQEKTFADLIINGETVEESYVQVFGETLGKYPMTKKEIGQAANGIWKRPMVQRYILEVEKRRTDVYVKSMSKEVMASNIIPIYNRLVTKAEKLLMEDDSRLHPKDVLKFTIEYGNQLTNLLGLNDSGMNSTEDKLRELINKVDISVGATPMDMDIIDVDSFTNIEEEVVEPVIDIEEEKELADAMLDKFK